LVIPISALRFISVILAILFAFFTILAVAKFGLFIAFMLAPVIAAAVLVPFTLLVYLVIPLIFSAIITFNIILLLILLQ